MLTNAASYGDHVEATRKFVPFLAFDTEIRRVICSTNAIEAANARIRRAAKARQRRPPSSYDHRARATGATRRAVHDAQPPGPAVHPT